MSYLYVVIGQISSKRTRRHGRFAAPRGRHPDAINWPAVLLNPGKQRSRSFNRARVECINYLLAGFRQEGAQVDSDLVDSVDPSSQDHIQLRDFSAFECLPRLSMATS
jgi:hypothetical protein